MYDITTAQQIPKAIIFMRHFLNKFQGSLYSSVVVPVARLQRIFCELTARQHLIFDSTVLHATKR